MMLNKFSFRDLELSNDFDVEQFFEYCSSERMSFKGAPKSIDEISVGLTRKIYHFDDCVFLEQKTEEMDVPNAYIKEKVIELIENQEAKENRLLSGREKKDIKEAFIKSIQSKMFTKCKYHYVYFDFKNKRVYYDNEDVAFNFIQDHAREHDDEKQRISLKEFIPFNLDIGASLKAKVLDNWFATDENQSNLDLGQKCTIAYTDESKASIAYKNLSMQSENIKDVLAKHNITTIKNVELIMGEDVAFTFDVSTFSIAGIKNKLIKKKFDPKEEDYETFIQSNLMTEITVQNQIVHDLYNVFEIIEE